MIAIFLPFGIVKAQLQSPFGEPTITSTSTWQECHFFNPRTFDNATPSIPSQNWNYTDATCTSPTLQNIISGTSTFYLEKSWDYGELFIAFLLVIIILFLIFKIVFDFFFEPVIKIRGKQ